MNIFCIFVIFNVLVQCTLYTVHIGTPILKVGEIPRICASWMTLESEFLYQFICNILFLIITIALKVFMFLFTFAIFLSSYAFINKEMVKFCTAYKFLSNSNVINNGLKLKTKRNEIYFKIYFRIQLIYLIPNSSCKSEFIFTWKEKSRVTFS